MRITQSFRWVFPIIFDTEEPLNKELENLSPDFWRFELEAAKRYIPRDYKTGNVLKFDLLDFIKVIDKIKTNFGFYLGSETTPPCNGKLALNNLDRVLYLMNLKPIKIPNCQFKIFRENTLRSNRERETHARNLQENIKGGKPQIRRIQWSVVKKKTLIIKKIMLSNKPSDRFEAEPNCEISREISR